MSDVENYTERDYAGSSIRIVSWVDRVQQIISINVYVGPNRSELSATFPLSQRTAAATHYAFVQNGARAGRTEAALVADLRRTPVGTAGEYRSVRATRTRVFTKPLTAAQREYVEVGRRAAGRVLAVEQVPSWLTLQAIVDKGYAEVLERDGGRPAGKILSVRVHS